MSSSKLPNNRDPQEERFSGAGTHDSACSRPPELCARAFSPRLAEILWQLRGLSYDDMCTLAVFVRELILDEDRRRARELERHVGERCDVVWPGQCEVKNAMLTAVNSDKVVATVERFPDVKPREVPVFSVFISHSDQRIDDRLEPPTPLAFVPRNASSPNTAQSGGSLPETAA